MTAIQRTKLIVAFALAALAAAPSAFAQAPTAAPTPQHQSIFHKLFSKKQPSTMQPGTMTHQPYGTSHMPYGAPHRLPYGTSQTRMPYGTQPTGQFGNIIGNKHSHVYHMAGDTGSLPAPQNRVYFTTEAQAMAAGYHRSGSGHSSMQPHTMSHKMHSTAPIAPVNH